MKRAGVTLLVSGAAVTVWASRVETGAPGWRNAVAGGLLVAGCALTVAGVVS